MLASKAIALGELLPPLQLVCYDAQDNQVAPAADSDAGAFNVYAGKPSEAVDWWQDHPTIQHGGN